MIIYHGHPSSPSLQKCRQIAPSYRHGAEFSDRDHTYWYDEPYIVDNGAFAAFKNGDEWSEDEFLKMLAWADEHQRDPDFVVIPDVVGDADATYERSREWADRIDFTTYMAVQDGMAFDHAVSFAQDIGASGIFVGGSKPWKRKTMEGWVTHAHDAGLKCHIARPSDYTAVDTIGADSMDTTSVVAWGAWWRLKQLEAQATFADYPNA